MAKMSKIFNKAGSNMKTAGKMPDMSASKLSKVSIPKLDVAHGAKRMQRAEQKTRVWGK